MPLGGSWKRPGGRGWAALNGQLQSNTENDNHTFPPLTVPFSNPRLRPIDVPELPPFLSANINNSNDSMSTVMPNRPNTSESQSYSEPTSSNHVIPIEPDEWEEEDDIYSRHRREAVRAARAASRHSKAAAKAFLRGDHHSARQHSLTARHQHSAAQALHADAAASILTLRNPQDDPCNLDLHGLHAAEAVLLLQRHLHRVETQPPQKRPAPLQVITGVGNHSRGEPSLPAAVRGFLNENGPVMSKNPLELMMKLEECVTGSSFDQLKEFRVIMLKFESCFCIQAYLWIKQQHTICGRSAQKARIGNMVLSKAMEGCFFFRSLTQTCSRDEECLLYAILDAIINVRTNNSSLL